VDNGIIEAMCRMTDPHLFSDDPDEAKRAASPYDVERSRAVVRLRNIDALRAALETALAAEGADHPWNKLWNAAYGDDQ
jgi:hypothetical protein